MNIRPETLRLSKIPDEMLDNAGEACSFLKSLTHETRLLILCHLMDREYSVTELEEALGLRQPAVSQQLARLRSDELVNTRRDGKTIYYSLASDEVRRMIGLLYEMFCKTK
jgi:DNA-binding transcriptional ArsR family regulator